MLYAPLPHPPGNLSSTGSLSVKADAGVELCGSRCLQDRGNGSNQGVPPATPKMRITNWQPPWKLPPLRDGLLAAGSPQQLSGGLRSSGFILAAGIRWAVEGCGSSSALGSQARKEEMGAEGSGNVSKIVRRVHSRPRLAHSLAIWFESQLTYRAQMAPSPIGNQNQNQNMEG